MYVRFVHIAIELIHKTNLRFARESNSARVPTRIRRRLVSFLLRREILYEHHYHTATPTE